MTAFRYAAVDKDGIVHSGVREASTPEETVQALFAVGQTPMYVRVTATPSWTWLHQPIRWRARVSRQDVLAFTRSLHPLLRAGLTLDRALGILGTLSERAAVKTLLAGLVRSVREGASFADALAQTNAFPAHYLAMVRAGELGGSLTTVIGRLAEFLDRSERIRDRLKSALIYPLTLGGMILITLALLVTVVLPRFEQMFAESHATLPLVTRVVLGFGRGVTNYGWLIAAFSAIAVFAAYRALRRPALRLQFDAWLLRSRLTFGLIARVDTARFLRTLGTLMTNGVPAAQALRVARGVLANRALIEATDRVIRSVREGESLAMLLASVPHYPRIAGHLARVGEETGQLEPMLLEAADILDRETELTTERLLALFVPVITIGMGALVAGLIGSVLVGLLSVNDLAF